MDREPEQLIVTLKLCRWFWFWFWPWQNMKVKTVTDIHTSLCSFKAGLPVPMWTMIWIVISSNPAVCAPRLTLLFPAGQSPLSVRQKTQSLQSKERAESPLQFRDKSSLLWRRTETLQSCWDRFEPPNFINPLRETERHQRETFWWWETQRNLQNVKKGIWRLEACSGCRFIFFSSVTSTRLNLSSHQTEVKV